MSTVIATVFLLIATCASASDSYSVHLEPAMTQTSCSANAVSPVRQLTHRFRGDGYPDAEISIRDGRNVETNVLGGTEWITTLGRQETIPLTGDPAILLVVFSDHVGGSGSWTHILVVRCRQKRLEVIFEASGRGLHPTRGYSYAADRGLRIMHAVWLPHDSSADPSREIVETYRWQPERERFVLAEKHEQPITRS